MVEWDRHAKKWGELKHHAPRVASHDDKGKPASYYWDSYRDNAVTEEQKEQEREDFRAGCLRADAAMKRDQARLYGILAKYLRTWWD
jgi:hypothetical protein